MQNGFSAVQASCTRERLGELSLGPAKHRKSRRHGEVCLVHASSMCATNQAFSLNYPLPEQSENPNQVRLLDF